MKRVVVTGLGLVTPLAGSVNKSWDKLINAESGIGKIEGFNVEDLPAKIAGHVPDSEKDKLRAVATDGHRLAKFSHEIEGKIDQVSGVIIPKKTIYELSKLLSEINNDEE